MFFFESKNVEQTLSLVEQTLSLAEQTLYLLQHPLASYSGHQTLVQKISNDRQTFVN